MFSDTRKIIGSTAATLGVVLLAAATAGGTLPGENGRIAFMRKDDAGLVAGVGGEGGPPPAGENHR